MTLRVNIMEFIAEVVKLGDRMQTNELLVFLLQCLEASQIKWANVASDAHVGFGHYQADIV